MSHTPTLLEIVFHDGNAAFDRIANRHRIGLSGLCAGFEDGKWRRAQLAAVLLETWLPEFALRHSELQDIDPRRIGSIMRRAARAVYQSKKFAKRGEFGELILHAVMCQVFETLPAVSKIYYKDAPNATVHGFDAVHVVPRDESLELWLGEAKFYGNPKGALADAAKSLREHEDRAFLRNEFAVIVNMIDQSWPYAARLKKLLEPTTTLDKIFDAVCLPVLVTYDSHVLARHSRTCEQYVREVREEWEELRDLFAKKRLPRHVKIHLFLIPLNTKKTLVKALHEELRKWQ